jgi:hypothetical protein
MKPSKIEVVTPEPYYKIAFECSNRAFYNVKNELCVLWDKSGIEDDFNNGHFTEKCDYEGDLEEIIIYANDKIKPFIDIVLREYGGNEAEIGSMNLVLSIF